MEIAGPRRGDKRNKVKTGIKLTVVAIGLKSLSQEFRAFVRQRYGGDYKRVDFGPSEVYRRFEEELAKMVVVNDLRCTLFPRSGLL